MQAFQISLPTHFHWSHLRAYLTGSPEEMLHFEVGDWLYRWERGMGIFRIRVEEAQKQVEVEMLEREKEAKEAQRDIETFVEEWLDLRRDLRPFYQMVQDDDLLGPLIRKDRGLRIGGIPDLWECAAWAIVGQQVNVAFAKTLKKRLIENFGNQRRWNSHTFWQFPPKEVIAALEPEDLRSLAISQRKAEYLIDFARILVVGDISKEKLKAYPSASQAAKELTKIRGIGKWSANYILLRCLRYPDAFPLGDAALYNAVRHLLDIKQKPKDEDLLALAENWKGWEAYAAYHLWHSL